MEDLPLGRIAALVPEFAVKDLPLGRTLMMMRIHSINCVSSSVFGLVGHGLMGYTVTSRRFAENYVRHFQRLFII